MLARCADAQAHVVVQGGNTGLVGGAVPEPDDVLLLTERLTAMKTPDTVAQTVVAGAGVTLAALQTELARSGLELAVDLASRDNATVGGMAATDAGGVRVLRDGTMRRQVLSATALDVDGREITELHPLVKDNTGYDLTALLVGSEGTLGVLTALLLRVVPVAEHMATALIGLPDLAAVEAFVARVRRGLPSLRAAEVMSRVAMELIGEPPLAEPWALLLETTGPMQELAAPLSDTPNALVADEPAGRRALWRWREGITDAIAGRGEPVVKLDVTLPTGRLAELAADLGSLAPRQLAVLFGHVGDGNLHVNLLGPPDSDVQDRVLRAVVALGGSISAEHGIGRAKAAWLPLARTPAELGAMGSIKRALDPTGRLGRAIWPVAGSRCGEAAVTR